MNASSYYSSYWLSGEFLTIAIELRGTDYETDDVDFRILDMWISL